MNNLINPNIELNELSVGYFEIDNKENCVFVSTQICHIMGISNKCPFGCTVSIEKWEQFTKELVEIDGFYDENFECKEHLFFSNTYDENSRKWFKFRMERFGEKTVGVILDVTFELFRSKRLEYELNIDPLTGLLNKNKFINKVNLFIYDEPEKIGIFMFMDLDNLKKANDNYGHDFGDKYIQAFAEWVSHLRGEKGIVSRLSGDEFASYLHGFSTKDEARDAFNNCYEKLDNCQIIAPDGEVIKLSASIGLSYYPDDSLYVDDLLNYSDQAMYEVKRSGKNSVIEFNKEKYLNNKINSKNNNIIDMIFNEKRLQFAYQPIVCAKTANVFAYEVLMRPMLREFKSPLEILRIVKSQSKLDQLEQMTFRMIFNWISENKSKIGESKICINSLPQQALSTFDFKEFEEDYKYLFGKMVIEVAENNFSSQTGIDKRIETARDWGAKISVDNFKGKYFSDDLADDNTPEFIKIDMALVRDCDKDEEKRTLIQNIISYSKKRRIETVAEGIENSEEMNTVLELGVDYLQGFYLGKPEYELKEISSEVKEQILLNNAMCVGSM